MQVETRPATRQSLRFSGPWRLQLGGVLPGVEIAFETYGRLNAAGDNAVLVCHALTGDAHPAAHHAGDAPGWWEGMIGPGRPIDTGRWFVVCSNVLGGCAGSTGAASPHPEDGRPYGLR
ncbi:MAG TPA: homoserine O-acetyltransferase, partial [Bacillota bacterium]